MRIGVLNNLRAGRSQAQVHRLLRLLKDYPDVLHVETDQAGAVPDALADLARQEVNLLVVNGGDGTLQHALTEILEHNAFDGRVPQIAVLPGGRTNMTAKDIGTRGTPVTQLRHILEGAKAGTLGERVERRHVLRVEYGHQREVRCGMFFGAGVIHRAIDYLHANFPQGGGAQGALGSTLITATLVARLMMGKRDGLLTPDKAHILVDGELHEHGEFRLLMASTVHRLFAGMRPFWGSGHAGVRLTTMTPDARQLRRALPGILSGEPNAYMTTENGYSSCNAKRVDMRLNAGFTIDGEQFPGEEARAVSLTADHVVRFISGR